MMKFRISFTFLLAVFATGLTYGQTTSNVNLTEPIPQDPNIRTGTLPNGMKYVIRRNAEPENRAELRLAVNAGSMQEDDDQQGLAHFTEHMAFNGTEHFKKSELVDYLESIGTKFGAHLNAYTSFDETVYMLQVPTDDATIMDKALLVLEDWSSAVAFDHTEIDKERGVVIEEWRLGLGADERMMQRYFPVLFKDSRYAVRLPIGKKEILESFTYETVKRFYKKWYRPDLMSVIIVGDFDPAQMEEQIKSRFSKISKPADALNRPVAAVPDHTEPHIAVERDKEAPMTVLQLMIMHPVDPYKTVGDFRNQLLDNIVSEMINGRLEELKSAGKTPFLFAGTGQGSFIRAKETFFGFAVMNPEGVQNGTEIMFTELERARQHGFNPSELERTKKKVLTELENQYNKRNTTESDQFAMGYVQAFLVNAQTPGVEWRFNMAKNIVPSFSIEEVNAHVKKLLTRENVNIVLTGPEKEGIVFPTPDQLSGTLSRITASTLEPWKDIVDDRPLIAKEPVAGKVTAEKKNEVLGITEWTLSNGAKVILKATDFKDEEIVFRAWSPGGSSRSSDKDYMSASNSAQIVEKGGAGQFNDATLRKKLSDKVVSVSPYIDELGEGFWGDCASSDIETMLQLVYLYHTKPRQDKEAFANFITEMKSFAAMNVSPEAIFTDSSNVFMYQNHPRVQPITETNIATIDLTNAYMFYLDRFGDASDFTYMFVGDMDPATMKPLIEKYIGGLPGQARKETWKDTEVNAVPGVVKKTLHHGTEPKSFVMLNFHGPMEYNADEVFKMKAVMKVLSIMLRESMREEKGGVYGVRSDFQAEKYPDAEIEVMIQWGCSPDNVEELILTAMNDIKTLQNEGPSEVNMQKMRETFRREMETNLRDNDWWMRMIEKAVENGDSFEDVQEIKKRYETITAEDVQEAAKKYMNMDQYFQCVLLPGK